ncbi:MAG: hypothetical protein CME65_03480 [Halobacteriovoraceae bacterium]|nr:hypothetical protein [Halobacteriovoraceae bacterium]|tara:strand:+ start:1400 stop:1645 length:246 start_codon:yes stop_codon:yes gene_type:complete
MDKDKFIEVLIEEYSEQVKDIIITGYSNSGSKLNFRWLNGKLQALRIDQSPLSLSEDEWYELIFELAPDVYDDLYYGRYAA